jgi:hypothetical protein
MSLINQGLQNMAGVSFLEKQNVKLTFDEITVIFEGDDYSRKIFGHGNTPSGKSSVFT